MIGDLIALMFLSRDLAHRAHLMAQGEGSYARHKALGEFYEEIIGIADSLAEAFMGRTGEVIEKIPLLAHKGSADIIEALQSHLEWIEKNRYEAVSKDDTPLQNIIDEAVASYLSTLYKLRILK